MADAGGTTRNRMFNEVMTGNWDTVLDMYRRNEYSVQEAKITRSEDTVLHIAVSEENKTIVQRLVQAMAPEASYILGLKNDRGDTPLHLAAALGMVEICAILASRNPDLVTEARNNNGENPLFVAALYGKKYAFFVLQDAINRRPESSMAGAISYCRRSNGDTILHTAIYGEYFDLAFEIIHLYPDLINFYNERGQTALHLLADKPSVFKSGGRIRRTDNLIYTCIIVDPLKVKYTTFKGKAYSNGLKPQERDTKLPENYKTCLDLFALFTKLFHIIGSSFQNRSRRTCYIAGEADDTNNSLQEIVTKDGGDALGAQSNVQSALSRTSEGGEGGIRSEQSNEGDLEKQQQLEHDSFIASRLPQNYITCYNFFKIVMKVLLVVLGIGLRRIEKIKRKKHKHTYACQLMEELVTRASHWKYEEDGKKPDRSPKEYDLRLSFSNEPIIEDGQKNMTESTTNNNLKPENKVSDEPVGDTPILVATKKGVMEMVKKILDTFPVAI